MFTFKMVEKHIVVKEAVNINNNRTGRNHDIPISSGAIRAIDMKRIKDS
ncbi:MAG: hypothetical protein WBD99_00945 [Thermodesulfobacteriota bacterium]